MQKVPFLLVVGDKEAEAGKVNVRSRGKEKTEDMPAAEFVEKIKKLIADKRPKPITIHVGTAAPGCPGERQFAFLLDRNRIVPSRSATAAELSPHMCFGAAGCTMFPCMNWRSACLDTFDGRNCCTAGGPAWRCRFRRD